MRIRQSDLAAYGRCAQQKKLYDQAREGLVKRPPNLSRTVYGTVVHHAVQAMERLHAQGDPKALDVGVATFTHYWNPENLPELAAEHPELVHGIDQWLPRDTYGGFRMRGIRALEDYYAFLRDDPDPVLALELNFEVPVDLGPRGQHVLTGTVDRLALRRAARKPYVSVEDHKTGKQPTFLRHALQFTIYCYATTRPEFWREFPDGNERWQMYADWPRRGTWNDLRENKRKDCGWRGELDYQRMFVALAEYVRAVEADIYPLTVTGETCTYCPFRDGTCGGVPVPAEDYGKP